MLDIKVFGQNLYLERKKRKGMTQDKLSELSQVTVQTISGYEQGTKSPSLKNAISIANALGLSLDYLCNGSDVSEQNNFKFEIETLADIQSLFDFLYEKIPDFSIEAENDDIFLRIEDCPQIAKYYKDYLTLKDLLDEGTITPDIFDIWKNGATKNLKTTSIEDYKLPF